ncbi:sugar kinase [Microbacterium sulfonylureivorans]|uniref:sugar kinase n=1 Tax=Microbacterium sulfonylureivorans TaxID=2486854 RepID=UPI0013E0157C|nr:sugar kinase [Microbacterium sulfonylureivorans]
MIDCLCIGEALIAFSPIDAPTLSAANEFDASVGGAEVNVAIALAQAGLNVEWAGLVGADPFGERVVAHLSAHGVGTRHVRVIQDRQTGIYMKPRDGGRARYYRRESAAAGFGPADVDRLARTVAARVVHTSGIAAQASEPGRLSARHLLEDRPFFSALMSFDVNFRPAIAAEGADRELRHLAACSDVVFVGRDEAASLWGVRTAEQARELLPEPDRLVVKDADREAIEFHREQVIRVPATKVDVIEPTGAGDAFAAGWITAHLAGHGQADRLAAGHASAARALRSPRDHAVEPVSPGRPVDA